MQSIIVGTAGHIDHGKSALVRALTGTDPDRLPEEKKRGITIDLGFADFDLGDVRIGFVDVPGHERFVKNMLAGAHGIDLVTLVVAADEGVMPQTREHFDICRLLNVRHGLLVITKTDLVEDELIPLVRDEIEELVAGSFLENAPILAVSARSGSGLDELRAALRQMAIEIPARPSETVTRLPVDRAFTMKGFGAVVTGTLVSGEIREGDELELLPQRIRVRARGVQVHGHTVPRALAGQRTAVNLGGIDTASIERGMVLAPVGRLHPAQIIDVQLDVLRSAVRPLRSRARVRLHIGAAEVLGRVRVLNSTGALEPGTQGFAQMRLEMPVVALPDERFIIRSYSPSVTIAGGRVLDPFAVKHRGKDLARVAARLTELLETDQVRRLVVFVESAGPLGLKLTDIAARTGLNDSSLKTTVHDAVTSGAIIDAEGVLLATENFAELSQNALAAVAAHHKREPLSRGLGRETLRERHFGHAPAEIFRAVLAHLEKEGQLVADKDLVRASDHSLDLSGADVQLRDRLADVYVQAGLEAPSVEEAMERAGVLAAQRAHARKILQLLIDARVLIRLQGDLFFHQHALDQLQAKLESYAAKHEPERTIDVSSFKDLAGVSRKYAIPLLEFFDSKRVTVRQGDKRVIVRMKDEG
ncbi:MAG: selenocysteine-specific translation elongation factor SelB [Acidobacteria bacterium]|nr:selenocysteine-specific translation elongation factor SelB [Acidobacteriota bacterium]